MPKIILGVSHSFCANFLIGQVNFLNIEGYEVVIISGPGEEISMLSKKENAKLITIPFSQKISPLKDFFQLLYIIKIIKREKPDIINAGNPKSGFLIMLACWLTGFKNRIFTLHGLVSDTKKGFIKWMIVSTEKISCNIAKLVIVVSPSLKKHAEERKILKKGKGTVLEKGSCNGIDVSIFTRTSDVLHQSEILKEKLGIISDNILIGFVGRLCKDKGIDILFEVFNKLIKKYPFIRLVLAGPILEDNQFSKTSMYQLQHDEHVFYLGKMIDVTPVYGMIDMLVLPSYREGFGNVLIEAAAMEIAVIAPEIPGCSDAVKKNENGFLFEKGNIDELYQYIEKLITNKSLRISFGKKGRLFAEQNFSNCKIWEAQVELYKQLIM